MFTLDVCGLHLHQRHRQSLTLHQCKANSQNETEPIVDVIFVLFFKIFGGHESFLWGH